MSENTALVKENNRTIRKVIPDDMLNRLLNIRDGLSRSYWEVGDIVNELYSQSVANGLGIGRLEVCAIIGDVIGKSARSARFYGDISSMYTLSERNDYEVLPFSHFAFAAKFGENRFEVLDKCMDYFAERGMYPSVETLQRILNPDTKNFPQERETNQLPPVIDDTPDVAKLANAEAEDIVKQVENILVSLPSLLSRLSYEVQSPTVSQELARTVEHVRQTVRMLQLYQNAPIIVEHDIYAI